MNTTKQMTKEEFFRRSILIFETTKSKARSRITVPETAQRSSDRVVTTTQIKGFFIASVVRNVAIESTTLDRFSNVTPLNKRRHNARTLIDQLID